MADGADDGVNLSNLPYKQGEAPGQAPAKTPIVVPQTQQTTPQSAAPDDGVKLNLPYKPGESPGGPAAGAPPSTPLDQPMPGYFSRPEGQTFGGWSSDLWGHITQGASQSAADKARIIADTYTYGQGDRALSGQLTGPALEAERQKTADAWKREGVMAPFDATAAYILPGPSWLTAAKVPGAIASKTLPYITQAVPAASKAAQEAIARVAGYAGEAGLTSGLQDIGHDIYDPAQVGGDVAIGSVIGGAAHGVNEAVAAGANRIRDWARGGAPSGTPAQIAAANPTNPHAQQFAEWHENIMKGDPPSPDDIKTYAQGQYGKNMANWPSPLVNIYNASTPRTLGPLARVGIQGITAAGQFGLARSGLLENPTAHAVIQAGAGGAGLLFDQARNMAAPMRVSRAMDAASPSMTGMYSTGPTRDAAAWRDAFHKLVLGESQPPP